MLTTGTGRATAASTALFYLLVWWRILARAGFPGGLAFLMLVPPLAFAVWAFLAFAPWPARRELTALRKVQRVMHETERRRLIA
jgi:hypothetical protein